MLKSSRLLFLNLHGGSWHPAVLTTMIPNFIEINTAVGVVFTRSKKYTNTRTDGGTVTVLQIQFTELSTCLPLLHKNT